MLSVLLFTACKDDDKFGPGNIKIIFPASELEIDLNKGTDNPPVVSVVNSDNDLSKVDFYILKGDVVEHHNTVTSFPNPKSYSFKESLTYTGDMTGVRVVATDVSGHVQTAELPFNVKQIVGAPEIVFTPESIEMNEGDDVPEFSIVIKAESPLKKISLYKVVNGIQTPADDPIDYFEEGQTEYTIRSSEMANMENIFVPGVTGLKVEVEDEYGKTKIGTMTVKYNELPAPEVAFDDQSGDTPVAEFDPLTILGTVTSHSDLVKATLKLRKRNSADEYETVETKQFDPGSKSGTFSFTIESISSDYDAVVVEVVDILGKTGKATKEITVTPVVAPEIALPHEDYYGIAKGTAIQLSENKITCDGFDLKSVVITTTTLDGTKTEIVNEDNIGQSEYTSDKTIEAASDLAGISITATNVKGKTATVEIPVTVDFWRMNDVRMQEQIKRYTVTDHTQPCVFSAVERRSLSLQEAFSMQSACDFSFYVSSIPQVRICKTGDSSLPSKYKNETYGFGQWTVKNETRLGLIKHTTIEERDAFFNTLTTDAIKTLPQSLSTNNKSVEKDFLELVIFETVDRDGKKQRGVIRVDGVIGPDGEVDPAQTLSPASEIKMSIIVTTPY